MAGTPGVTGCTLVTQKVDQMDVFDAEAAETLKKVARYAMENGRRIGSVG